MTKTWKNLESHVKSLCEMIFERSSQPDRINGVNYDNVVHISDDEIAIIEVTEERSLDKVRTDVGKIYATKLAMAAQGTVVKAFIVMRDEPTQGMVDIGSGTGNIKVQSIKTFAKQAFDFDTYQTVRKKNAFGSSIDSITGEPDENTYIPVSYITSNDTKIDINQICKELERGKKIVLLGEYGTGKSRCVREAFEIIKSTYEDASAYPIAINLREHWGAQSGVEIISGHFKRLGLSNSIDRAMQLLQGGHLLLLLDGFDEVGTQTFGNSEERRATIRRHALNGVRDLLSISKGGALITGRPHYFNDNGELLNSLGLDLRDQNTQLIRCREEFEETQANAYLAALGFNAKTPEWLPKKPLMFQIMASMEKDEAEKILNSNSGEVGFWGQFIDTVCIREARMHPSIESSTVRSVLGHLARVTRTSNSELGRLTPRDIQQAYESATGYNPDESGQLMLSRLCTLGRIEPESPDRQFVDPYIVQLLFADCVIEDISNKNHSELLIAYKQPLQAMGLYFLAQWIETYDFEAEAVSFIHRDGTAANTQMLGEIVAALMLIEAAPIDLHGAQISGAEICMLDLGIRKLTNVEFIDGIIHHISFNNCVITSECNFKITKMEVIRSSGLSSDAALPSWMTSSQPKIMDNISTASRIKTSALPPAQKLFLSIIHKIFFQRGMGRKENSLYKGGFGQAYDRKVIDHILQRLVSENIIERSKDSSGHIYNPKREHMARMKLIKDQLSLCKDPLWEEFADFK